MASTLPLPLAAEIDPPAVDVPTVEGGSPAKTIDPVALKLLGERLRQLFEQYRSDRRIAELRWLRNQRQYLGVYDPEVEAEMSRLAIVVGKTAGEAEAEAWSWLAEKAAQFFSGRTGA